MITHYNNIQETREYSGPRAWNIQETHYNNHLGGGPVIRAWDQEVCFLYGLRFEPCGCSYDGHWRLTWSLLVNFRARGISRGARKLARTPTLN
jgi:hypothetical protein